MTNIPIPPQPAAVAEHRPRFLLDRIHLRTSEWCQPRTINNVNRCSYSSSHLCISRQPRPLVVLGLVDDHGKCGSNGMASAQKKDLHPSHGCCFYKPFPLTIHILSPTRHTIRPEPALNCSITTCLFLIEILSVVLP